MKPRCGPCTFFKSHKPTTIGAGGNSECYRIPGYYRSGVMDACGFYSKKGKKKVAKKEHDVNDEKVKCVDCRKEKKKKDARYIGTYGDAYLFRCLRCVQKRVDGPDGNMRCPRCGNIIQGTACELVGYHKPVCAFCYGEREKEGSLPVKVLALGDKPSCCTNCDAPFGKDGEYALPNLEGKVCFKCYDKLCSNPLYLVSNKDKRCGRCDGPLGAHTKAVEGYSRLLCAKCVEETANELDRVRDKKVGETPIHERYLVVEGRGSWPFANVYTHDFTSQERALEFIGRFKQDSCKMFRVSSASPIKLEELSLCYDVKVTSTHEIKVLK
jgi:hypothetical protein